MIISELINILEKQRAEHGDLPVFITWEMTVHPITVEGSWRGPGIEYCKETYSDSGEAQADSEGIYIDGEC